MLTKDQLQYRVYRGQVRPAFLTALDPPTRTAAETLCILAADAVGQSRRQIETSLREAADALGGQARTAAGLVKTLMDRMEFEEPSDAAMQLRGEVFAAAEQLRRTLPVDSTALDYEQLVERAIPDLPRVQAHLYADHPDERRCLQAEAMDGEKLIDRYNLGLVQVLVLHARRVVVTLPDPETRALRRLFRWLKFCRLVAEVRLENGTWVIEVTGPASVLDMAKRYGLQLAQFVGLLPVFDRWRAEATLVFGARQPLQLVIDQDAPLETPHSNTLGHIPDEIRVMCDKLASNGWEAEPLPTPWRVGAGDVCIPDLVLRRAGSSDSPVAIEFFHRWHRGALVRRLQQLALRPDPRFVLGVEEPLFGDEGVPSDLRERVDVVPFKGFPSERKLRACLDRVSPPAEGQGS